MTLKVAGKGDFTLLPQFKAGDFNGYELYLGLLDQSTAGKISSLPSHIQIVSIHTPTWILPNGKAYPFDLGQPDPIGSTAVEALKQTIALAKSCGAEIVVVHGASYNSFLEGKEEAMQRLAYRVRPLLKDDLVKLCFETDVLWHNLYYSRRALLTTAEDFSSLETLLSGKLRMTADFEHLSITFHFQQFITHCGGEQEFLKKYSEIAQHKFEIDCQKFIKDNYTELQLKFKEYLYSFFQTFHEQIEHIHINGSDCCNYLFNPQTSLPFVGEHLPIGFNERNVSDKLDYSSVASLLYSLPDEKDIKVVMEIWRTNAHEFVKASLASKKFLERYLDLKPQKETLVT